MKVVVAIDSFKGSLSSKELGIHIKEGIVKSYPNVELLEVPVADGGEGSVEALVDGTGGSYVKASGRDPLGRIVEGTYGIMGDGKTAVIEMASVSGLPLLKDEERNPMKVSTIGTGDLIVDAINKGCREFIIGIGGSATNDGGMGVAVAMGYKFLDESGNVLDPVGENLIKVKSIDTSGRLKEIDECVFNIACDVDNPFYGLNGAAHVYGKQKGADKEMILELDRGLVNLSKVYKETFSVDVGELSGAGAAGGLGGGLVACLGGKLKPGVDIILEKVELERYLLGADFVITGEGRIDFQSVMGKTPTGVSKLAKKHNIPVIAIAGSVGEDAGKTHDYGIDSIFSIMNYPMSLDEAMEPKRAGELVSKNIEEIFRLITICEKNFKGDR